MAKQLITIGTPGAGGGDPAHVAFKKFNDNATELYNQLGVDPQGNLPDALPITKGGTGASTAAEARQNLGTPARNEVIGLGHSYVYGGDIVNGATYFNTSPALLIIYLGVADTTIISVFIDGVNRVNLGGIAWVSSSIVVPPGASYRFGIAPGTQIVLHNHVK